MESNRIIFYDIARGIAMILVVLSHCVGVGMMGVNKTILCFHMPLFFFISGLFAKGPITWGGHFKEFAIHKLKVLMIPQLTLCGLRIVQSILDSLYSGKGLIEVQWLHWDWFLPVLLVCSLLYTSISSLTKSNTFTLKLLMLIISGAMVVVGQWLNKHEFSFFAIINSRHIAVLPMAFSFYVLGSMCKRYIPGIVGNTSVFHGLLLLVLLPVLYIIAGTNDMVLMYKNEYGKFPIFMLSCILGIYLVVNISKRLEQSRILSFVGINSIAIYVWNFIVVQITIAIANRLSAICGINSLGSIGLMAFVMSMMILYLTVVITNRYCPWIYGRS